MRLTRAGQGRGDDLARASRRCSASCRPTPRSRAETADLLLGVCVKRSFDRISVDGQLSTNDTAILQCSGASGVAVEPESEDELPLRPGARRAAAPARAGDRPRRRGRARASAASSCAAATSDGVERVARAVANSPLVKTALHGGDPNWGRIAQAVGHGAARHRAAAHRHRDRGRAGLRAAATRSRFDEAALAADGRAAARSSTSSTCPATATRPRSSSPTSATST